MTTRYLISLTFILILFANACFDNANKKNYSVTTYFISFDSSSNSMNKEGQKFKYSYEEYNSDSNLIYQELYATTDDFGDMWGKLMERTKFFYNGRQKIKAEDEYGIAYPQSEMGRGKGKSVDTYDFKDGLLVKWLRDNKPKEEYQYDTQKRQIERKIINDLNIPEYYRFYYDNKIKTKSQYFTADTIVYTDTFIYNESDKLIEELTYNSQGQKLSHRLIRRNDRGLAIEEKWRDKYNEWRIYPNGKIADDEFYEMNKYYYDNKDRLIKTEFYDLGKLMRIYEFQYD